MPESRHTALRAWVPAVLALLVQLGTTAAVIGFAGARGHSRFGPPGRVEPAAPNLGAGHPLPHWAAVALIALAIAGPALLAFIGRRPGPLLVGITAMAVAGTVLCAVRGVGAPFYLSVLLGAGASVFLRRRVWAWCCAGAYWLAFAAAFLISGELLQLGWLVPLTLLSIGALLGPEFGRSRQEARARAVREAEARRTEEAQAERVRIARELHDVLAHSLSQINVQASVALHLFDAQPAKAEEALASIKDASSKALGEVRQVLGTLRGEEAPLAPQHGLADLDALVAGVRGQGTEAALRVSVADASRLPAPVQQAAYRIVQEALTNVTRHARARHVEVVVAEVGPRLRVTVADDGMGAKSSPPGATSSSPNAPQAATTSAGSLGGRGLLGMKERAELLGGSFSAGPRPGTGFEVIADLPTGVAP